MAWLQIVLMVLGSLLSVISGMALFTFQRGRLGRIERETDMERRLQLLERFQATAMSEARFREIIKEELQSLELRLINEGRLEPLSHKEM